MRYRLAALWRRARKPRRDVVLRPVVMPSTLASDLYASAYAPVVKAWEGALAQILAQYERSLSAMTADSPAELGAVLTSTEAGVVSVYVSLRLRLQRWASRLEALHRGKWRGAVLAATGVDIGTLVGAGDMRDTLGAAVERNVGLIRSVNEQARTRIGEAVFRGLSRRDPAPVVARQLREAVAMSRRRALNIASDQATKLASALNDERRREAGVMTWEWVHSGKAHPREDHKARDGRRYSDDPADGAPPPGDRPGELINCGCTSRAVLSLDGEF